MIDRFLNEIFALSRVIVAFVVMLCLMIVTGGGLYFLVSGSEGLPTPDFDDCIEVVEDSSKGESELYERRLVGVNMVLTFIYYEKTYIFTSTKAHGLPLS